MNRFEAQLFPRLTRTRAFIVIAHCLKALIDGRFRASVITMNLTRHQAQNKRLLCIVSHAVPMKRRGMAFGAWRNMSRMMKM